MSTIKDSGQRREFATGAVRDAAKGKGSVVSISGAALLRMAKVMEGGAENYGRFNYMKGMPISDTVDSLGRHYVKYLDGWDDEDHLAMVAVNAVMAMETEDKHPELIDHPHRIGKSTFRYKQEQRSKTRDYKIFAVDFDGCLCKNAWPEIGEPNTDLIDRLNERRAAGDKLILWTCREGKALAEAVEWCRARGLEFDAVNANLPEMSAMYGNDSRKVGADTYIDDKAENVKA